MVLVLGCQKDESVKFCQQVKSVGPGALTKGCKFFKKRCFVFSERKREKGTVAALMNPVVNASSDARLLHTSQKLLN